MKDSYELDERTNEWMARIRRDGTYPRGCWG